MRPLHRIAIPLLALLAAAGCAMEAPGEQAIELDYPPDYAPAPVRDYDSFVAITQRGAEATTLCTGILIGPFAVLTPLDCVPGAAEEIEVVVGPDVHEGAPYRAQAILRDLERQLAVLVLRTAPPAYDARISTERWIEGYVDVVGYGIDHPRQFDLEAQRARLMYAVGASLRSEDDATCLGDVGAAVLDPRGQVVGIVTDVQRALCAPGGSGTRWRSLVEDRDWIAEMADVTPL